MGSEGTTTYLQARLKEPVTGVLGPWLQVGFGQWEAHGKTIAGKETSEGGVLVPWLLPSWTGKWQLCSPLEGYCSYSVGCSIRFSLNPTVGEWEKLPSVASLKECHIFNSVPSFINSPFIRFLSTTPTDLLSASF